MAAKEAKARIKFNKLLKESGWRFFDDANGKANIVLEPKVKLTKAAIDALAALGDNFEDAGNGFIDFLLLDEAGFPLVVLEAIVFQRLRGRGVTSWTESGLQVFAEREEANARRVSTEIGISFRSLIEPSPIEFADIFRVLSSPI